MGDPIVVRPTVSGTNEVHTWHIDGHWFRREGWSRRSSVTGTAHLGISERTDLVLPAAGGPQRRPGRARRGGARKPVVLRAAVGDCLEIDLPTGARRRRPLAGSGPGR